MSDVGIERLGERDIHRHRAALPRQHEPSSWLGGKRGEINQQEAHEEIRHRDMLTQTQSRQRISQLENQESQASLHKLLSKMPRNLSSRIQMGLLNKGTYIVHLFIMCLYVMPLRFR